jgi:hypothetical protein
MLLIDTYLAPSKIEGIGLFAKEPISKGTKVWEFTPGFDLELSPEEVDRLAAGCRERILNYAYFNAQKMRHILCSDDARFMNHSEEPNVIDVGFGNGDGKEGESFAARDIDPDEELTEDYRTYDQSGSILR